MRCSICGDIHNHYGVFSMHHHHYIKQQQYDKCPEWFIENGIEQRVIDLCFNCHDLLHHSSEKTFLAKCGPRYKARTGKELIRYYFLWNRKEWLKIVLDFGIHHVIIYSNQITKGVD
jgi:hypothetical protein